MGRNLYTLPPNRDLLGKAVRSLGFDTIDDTRWIDESHCIQSLMEEVKVALVQYMYPCMIKTYLDKEDFTYRDYLTVVRQLLRFFGRKLIWKEKCKTITKRTYKYVFQYSIAPGATVLPEERVVHFNLPGQADGSFTPLEESGVLSCPQEASSED